MQSSYNHFGQQAGDFLWRETNTIQQCSHPTPKYCSQRNKHLYSYKNLYANIYNHSSPNSQNVETTEMSFPGWTDEPTVGHLYNGKLFHGEANELLVYVTKRTVLKFKLLMKEAGHKLLYYRIPTIGVSWNGQTVWAKAQQRLPGLGMGKRPTAGERRGLCRCRNRATLWLW